MQNKKSRITSFHTRDQTKMTTKKVLVATIKMCLPSHLSQVICTRWCCAFPRVTPESHSNKVPHYWAQLHFVTSKLSPFFFFFLKQTSKVIEKVRTAGKGLRLSHLLQRLPTFDNGISSERAWYKHGERRGGRVFERHALPFSPCRRPCVLPKYK